MKVFNNISDLSKGLGFKDIEVERALNKYIGHNYAVINEKEIMISNKGNKLNYIVIDTNNNDDCKEYFMEFKQYDYSWKVYVDDLEGWQECKLIDIQNTRLGIDRATVITEADTKLNRLVKFAIDEDEIKPDRCIYFISK